MRGNSLKIITAPVLAIGIAVAANGALAQGGIDGSPHDLGGATAGDNTEICVYCHTPHGARTDIEAPLWNKPAGVGIVYNTYDSSTIDGNVLAVGSVSIACLSCHDGTQARDAVINGPGSGPGTMVAGSGAGPMPGGILANLGTDLRNDHPIGIEYGGFTRAGDTVQIDPDFKGTGTGLQTAFILDRDRWWVDTEGTPNAVRDKTDMILYTRDAGGGVDEPFVECGSCHDPHRAGTSPNFMRISNAGSAVCLSCHVK